MQSKRQLTTFFMSSFYTKPKQPILKAVLIIVFFYLFLQVTAFTAIVYFLGTTEQFMFYNLMISNLLVFILMAYLSITAVFHYAEFSMLTPFPISPIQITIAKITSSLIVPSVIAFSVQIPTFLFLGGDLQFIEAIKLLLFLPLANLFTALSYLLVLSFIHRYRRYFSNKTMYLMTNIIATCGVVLIFTSYVVLFSKTSLVPNLSRLDFSTWQSIKESFVTILENVFTLFLSIPIIDYVVTSFAMKGFSLSFVIVWTGMLSLSILFFFTIVKLLTVVYVQNAITDNDQQTIRHSKVYRGRNEWGNYFQREIWVIQTEAYFKLQILLSLFLAPSATLLFLIGTKMNWAQSFIDITKITHFEQYFTYAILLLSCMNNISGTPYSREGKYYHLLATLPFDKGKVYLSKVTLASITGISAVLMSYVLYFLFGYNSIDALVMLFVSVLLIICYNLLTPLFDMKNAIIEWENPSEAIKSNPNVLVSLLYGLPIPIIILLLHFLMIWTGVTPLFATFIITVISIGALINVWMYVQKKHLNMVN